MRDFPGSNNHLMMIKSLNLEAQASTGLVTIPDSTIGSGTTRFYRVVTPAQP